MSEENVKLEARLKGGGSIVALSPRFSDNAEYIYVAWKNEIICYSTKTAKRVYRYRGLKSNVVGFTCISIDNIEYVIACGIDGKVITWKASNALKLKELTLEKDLKVIHFKVFCEEKINSSTAKSLICAKKLGSNTYEFYLLNLDSGNLSERWQLNINKELLAIDISSEGQYYAVIQGRSLYCNQFSSNQFKHSIKGRKFTCVACHPEENLILTGDNTGRIILWHDIFRKHPTQAVYHWHTLPVKTLYFSTSGTYFYSGGSEAVLVKWDSADSNLKKFLPRLPAPINHINVAKNNIFLAVATEDNGVQIVNPQLSIVHVIQHLALSTDASAGMTYDSRSKMLILNGIAGHVQLFSLKDLGLAYSLDVVGQNKYTNERDQNIISTTITKVALSKCGLWMATVEHRADPDMFECRLKFWYFDTEKQVFSLNSSIEFPHEEYVKDVLFQPSQNESGLLCITVGDDKKFKVWELVDVSTVYYEGKSWHCIGEVEYKNLMPQVASFSNDGSLIAVGFESVITMWLSSIHELKSSLRHPIHDGNIVHLSFGSGSDCHLLFCGMSNYISVWNLLSLSLVWTVRVDVSLIVSDLSTSLKALFTKNKKLFIIDIKFPDPIYSSKKLLKNVGDIQAAQFVPNTSVNSDISSAWYQRSSIYFLDSNQELYGIGMRSEETDLDLYLPEMGSTLYGYILPQRKVDETTTSNTTHLYQKSNKFDKLSEFLDTPAHTAPPLHFTCESILLSMVYQYNEEKQKENDDDRKEELKSELQCDEKKEDKAIDLSKILKESTAWVSIFKDF